MSPASPVKHGPGTVNLPVVVGGLRVEAGDVVIGDSDDVVVVPFVRIDAVIKRLSTIRAAEAALVARARAVSAFRIGSMSSFQAEKWRRWIRRRSACTGR